MSRARSLRVTKECQPQGHGPPSRADNLNCIWATPESCSKSRSGPRPESHWHAAAGVTGLRDGHIHCSWSNLNRGRQRPSPATTGRRTAPTRMAQGGAASRRPDPSRSKLPPTGSAQSLARTPWQVAQRVRPPRAVSGGDTSAVRTSATSGHDVGEV